MNFYLSAKGGNDRLGKRYACTCASVRKEGRKWKRVDEKREEGELIVRI